MSELVSGYLPALAAFVVLFVIGVALTKGGTAAWWLTYRRNAYRWACFFAGILALAAYQNWVHSTRAPAEIFYPALLLLFLSISVQSDATPAQAAADLDIPDFGTEDTAPPPADFVPRTLHTAAVKRRTVITPAAPADYQ